MKKSNDNNIIDKYTLFLILTPLVGVFLVILMMLFFVLILKYII